MRGPGLLRRLLGQSPETDGDSAAVGGSALELADIQGFDSPRLQNADGAAFLVVGGRSGTRTQATRRLVSGDESNVPQITTAEDWHVGFAPGPGDDPTAAPRRTPDYCLNIGVTWPGLVALEIEQRVPTLSFKSFGAFIDGAARRAESVGETGPSSPQNWIAGFGKGHDHVLVTLHALSPDAMKVYSDRLCAWFAEGNAFRGNLAPRRDGVDRDAKWPTRAYVENSLRIHRRNHDAHDSRRPGAIPPRSPAALRAMAIRLARRR